MIFGILKEGVRGAFVRVIRTIVYILICLLIFYIIGLITSHKVSALSVKDDYLWNPDFQNKTQTYDFWSGSTSTWLHFPFSSNWTNTTDYDLIGFHFNNNSMIAYKSGSSTVYSTDNTFTITPILWDTSGAGWHCYLSGEYLDMALCPIVKNTTYNRFSIIVNVVDNNIDYTLHYQVDLERTRQFFNYDSTDIITYFQSSGGVGGMVVQQQQTNSLIEDTNEILEGTNTYITNGSTTSVQSNSESVLNGLSTDFTQQYNSNGGLYSTLTEALFAPINVALDSVDAQCLPLRWNIPLVNYQADIPCMSTSVYGVYFQDIMGIIALILVGIYAYRSILRLFRGVKEATDAEDDKIEVIDL